MAAEALRVMIVDDEPLAIERLRRLCAERADVEVVGAAEDGEAALAGLPTLRPDVVLLDIAMPGLSGLEVAAALDGLERPPAVVFCTAYDEHALAAFQVAAIDYLLKPVAPDRLARALARARAQSSAPPFSPWLQSLWAPHRSDMVRVLVDEIDWIEADRDYVRLHVDGRALLLHHTMAALQARLDPARFLRVHRSAIVRVGAVERLRHQGLGVWTVELKGGAEQRISRSSLAGVKRALTGA